MDLLERRQLDIVLGFAAANDRAAVTTAPMAWFGKEDLARLDTVPLAVLETPCRFREAAIRALEDAGRPYRITVETPNLTTLRAAVDAGLGLTCRTGLFLRDAPIEEGVLPALPTSRASCTPRRGSTAQPANSLHLPAKWWRGSRGDGAYSIISRRFEGFSLVAPPAVP